MNIRIRALIIIIFLSCASLFICPVQVKAEEKCINFADNNMYYAMKEALATNMVSFDDNSQSITITDEAIKKVTNLNISKKKISDLSGIENFTELYSLNITNNHIKSIGKIPKERLYSLEISYIEEVEDISLIENFSKLEKLSITNSSLKEFPEYIKRLENLKSFEWKDGVLENISGIGNLKNVTMLNLSNNNISNIDEIAKLEKLLLLYAKGNNISNIDAISNLKNLNLCELANNNISDISKINVDALKGFNVEYNCIANIEAFKDKASNMSFKYSGQLIRIEAKSGETIDLPSIIKLAVNTFGAKNIETINCNLSSDNTTCTIDENATYAKIKINDGNLKDSMIFFYVTNVQTPGVTGDTINFTLKQIIIIATVIVVWIIIIIAIAKLKNNKKRS